MFSFFNTDCGKHPCRHWLIISVLLVSCCFTAARADMTEAPAAATTEVTQAISQPWMDNGDQTVAVPLLSRSATAEAVEGKGESAVSKSGQGDTLLYYLTRRKTFEILGTDYDAVQSVGALAQALERTALAYFPYIESVPQPIWVRIEFSDEAVKPYFRMHIAENGNVGIRLYWNLSIDPEDVSRALSWALLQRVAIWRWGQRGEEAVPHWIPDAIGMEVLTQLQASRMEGLAEEMRVAPTVLLLASLLHSRQGETLWQEQEREQAALQAFWLYRFLRDHMRDSRTFGFLLEAFLSGEEPLVVLQRAFPQETANERLAQEWWEVGLTATLHRQRGVAYSLAESDDLLRSLSHLTAWWQGADHRLSGVALWPLREEPRWQSTMWRRQREIKLELSRVNPIYFNALLSLGQFYDLLLLRGGAEQHAVSRAELEAAYAQFLADFAHAQDLHRAVEAVLTPEPAATGR